MQFNGHTSPPPPYFNFTSHVPPAPVNERVSNNGPIINQMIFHQAPQINPIPIGHKPVSCLCPKCYQQITTIVDYKSGSFTWLMCILLSVIGCIPCSLIPFCTSSCQDIIHKCPRCLVEIGRYKLL